MRITTRRVSVIFETAFYDEDGELATPESATLTITYPTDCWPLDGSDLAETTIDLTADDSGTIWSGTWNSGASNPGMIFWHAEALTGETVSAPEDGHYRLRGNAANLTFVNT